VPALETNRIFSLADLAISTLLKLSCHEHEAQTGQFQYLFCR
jgi:hypothetical protein